MKDKRIVVGVTGGIAAYKACEIVSSLKKLGADVHVVMTKNACEFVSPLTFRSLSGNDVVTNMFFDKASEVKHISLAKSCDMAVIAPCTANIVGKIACGIADDFLTTFVMACKAPIVIAPAMNTNMYQNAAYQENALTLKKRGFLFVEPSDGYLACGDSGKGRLSDPAIIVEFIKNILDIKKDYCGKKVLVTAGATAAEIDPVRYIINRSSGKMGIEIARSASLRGADVTLILGKSNEKVDFNCRQINVFTTGEMFRAVMDNLDESDYIIKAAAPLDYIPSNISKNKIKDQTFSLTFFKGEDIAYEVGKVKGNKKLVIFAAETESLKENALIKLKNKNADMVVANNVLSEGAGFDVDTNIASLIFKDGKAFDLEKMTKRELAGFILDRLIELT